MTVTAEQPATRERITIAAAELFRRQGYAATGMKQIAAAADAPFGSIYHFFPGGKEQLGAEVLETGGAFFLALYRAITAEHDDPRARVRAFFDGAGATVEATGFADACPIATVAGEVASTNEPLRIAAANAFGSWLTALAADLEEAGVKADEAPALAQAILALLEGAFLLCRTLRTTAPMDAARDAADILLRAALSPLGTA